MDHLANCSALKRGFVIGSSVIQPPQPWDVACVTPACFDCRIRGIGTVGTAIRGLPRSLTVRCVGGWVVNTADLGHLCGVLARRLDSVGWLLLTCIDCCALGGVDPVLQAYTT